MRAGARKGIAMFDARQWPELISSSCTDGTRIAKAMALLEEGELSHAARIAIASTGPSNERHLGRTHQPHIETTEPG